MVTGNLAPIVVLQPVSWLPRGAVDGPDTASSR